jgi:hypothetical protein
MKIDKNICIKRLEQLEFQMTNEQKIINSYFHDTKENLKELVNNDVKYKSNYVSICNLHDYYNKKIKEVKDHVQEQKVILKLKGK